MKANGFSQSLITVIPKTVTHERLGTWESPAWTELLAPTLRDSEMRRAYD